jgi:putative hydrolase of the HAD superfamily
MGNVLVFFDFNQMISQVARCSGLSFSQVQQTLLQNPLRESFERGFIKTEQLYDHLLTKSPKSFTLEEFTEAFSNIFTPNTALWPLVSQLKKQGIRLILLSNTSECHFNFINARFPILKEFDEHILSYKIGSWKPDPRIFKKALEQAQCEPHECFYTDDILEFIEGAKQVGLNGALFTTPEKLKEDLIARGCIL